MLSNISRMTYPAVASEIFSCITCLALSDHVSLSSHGPSVEKPKDFLSINAINTSKIDSKEREKVDLPCGIQHMH